MDFDKLKKSVLEKPDKSTKGFIDKRIANLCELFNKNKDYFTLSSCAGRITIIKFAGTSKKTCDWVKVTHELADYKTFQKIIEGYSGSERLLFKQEAPILHICVRDMGKAQHLVDIAKKSGFKRSGIISSNKKIVVEIVSTDVISTPVYDKKKLVSNKYLEYLIKHANERLLVSWGNIDRLTRSLNEFWKSGYSNV